jgi:peptidoglycan/xylan/chitin deacetylase (PgdA/CDA1 family)
MTTDMTPAPHHGTLVAAAIALTVAVFTFGTLVLAPGPGPSAAPTIEGSATAVLPSACPAPPTASPSTSPTAGATVVPTVTVMPFPTASAPPTAPIPTATLDPTPRPTATLRPTPRPTATPRPTPPPTAAPTPTPEPTPRPPSILVRHGSRTSSMVALTFDMGGRVGDALPIVNWLVDHRVHATIFMTGEMADNPWTDAGRQVLAIIEAHPELFTLGNHSYTHRDFRNLTASEIRDEIARTEAALARSCSQNPRPFFRPPNGGYNADVLAVVGSAGYRYTVLWDVDTIDWRPIANDPPGPTADQIVTKVLGNAQGGSIVLMHLGGYKTFEALPRVVDGLHDRGFDLVSLDELL